MFAFSFPSWYRRNDRAISANLPNTTACSLNYSHGFLVYPGTFFSKSSGSIQVDFCILPIIFMKFISACRIQAFWTESRMTCLCLLWRRLSQELLSIKSFLKFLNQISPLVPFKVKFFSPQCINHFYCSFFCILF